MKRGWPQARAASVACLVLTACTAACNVGARDDVVTWADVRPLLETSCLECHASTFGTYEGARDKAHAMLAMVEAQLMPPGGIDRSGACNDFDGPRPLRDDEIATLRAWIDVGTPHEVAQASPPAWAANPRTALTRAVEASFALDAAPDDAQRCIVVDVAADVDVDVVVDVAPGAEGDAAGYLAGVQVVAPRALHHAMVFTVAQESPSHSEDSATAAESWACDGVPRGPNGEAVELAFAWTPGRDVVSFPEGTGVALTRRVIVQWHEYGPLDDDTGADTASHATLTLHIADDVARPLSIVPVAIAGFSLPPGDDTMLSRPVSLPAGEVVGVMPHLHVAGRSLHLSLARDDDTQCIVSAPRYDFAFQEVAFFRRPLRFEAGATGTLTCTWDTRDRTQPTRWGERSVDEMCTAFLFVAR